MSKRDKPSGGLFRRCAKRIVYAVVSVLLWCKNLVCERQNRIGL